ncbi:PP0621 family protein [Pseudomonas sp. 2FG]|uniref:PP0621 family protein n=1 Tax=Pseudomonas sp. 2FG TaxID=2502191 RepID=UPI0010F571CC|nr:PP0621 family protein [Pseudomonas sp. 2FG]
MGRLLFWIALISVAFWLWRRFNRPARPRPKADEATPMVRCAHCGVHVPREHALQQNQQWFCSQAHLEQGTKHGER